MPQIIDLPQATTLDGSEVGIVVQDGITKKATMSLMRQPQTPLLVKFNDDPITLSATELVFTGNVIVNGVGNSATVDIPVPEFPDRLATARKINGVLFDGSADIWGFGKLTVVNAAATGSVNVDFSQVGIYDYTLSGNTTLVPTSLPALSNETRSYLIRVRQTGTARTLTWWSGITWIATSTPAAPAANKMVEYIMSWDGTNWLGRKGASN